MKKQQFPIFLAVLALLVSVRFWLVLYSKPSNPVSLTPFTFGFWLVYVGFGMLLLWVIAPKRVE